MVVYRTIEAAIAAAEQKSKRDGGALWYVCNALWGPGFVLCTQGQEFGMKPIRGVRVAA